MSPRSIPAGDLVLALQALEEGRVADAEATCRGVLAENPHNAAALNLLGVAAHQKGDLDGAIDLVRQAVAADGSIVQHWSNLCRLCRQARRWDEAEEAGRRALALAPGHLSALRGLAGVLAELGRPDEAIALYRDAVEQDPADRVTRAALGQLLLGRGEFAEGWRQYAQRPRRVKAPDRVALGPAWQGETLAAHQLLVYCEQGYGDTLQFCRYLQMLKDVRPAVLLRAPAALRHLLAHSMPWLTIDDERESVRPHDYQCSVMDLPAIFGADPAAGSPAPPYLEAPPLLSAAWRTRLGSADGLRIGLVWAGNARQVDDAGRSLAPELIEGLIARPGMRFFSLQVGPRAGEAARFGPSLVDLSSYLTSFAETAAAIENLDLVVTVDTAVAHLAGALGKPGCVLLRHPPDWHWSGEASRTPWYPTLRLFRQSVPGDWRQPVSDLAAALAAFPSSPGA